MCTEVVNFHFRSKFIVNFLFLSRNCFISQMMLYSTLSGILPSFFSFHHIFLSFFFKISFLAGLTMATQDEAHLAELKKKRTFRKFTYRGVDLDQLLDMSRWVFVWFCRLGSRRIDFPFFLPFFNYIACFPASSSPSFSRPACADVSTVDSRESTWLLSPRSRRPRRPLEFSRSQPPLRPISVTWSSFRSSSVESSESTTERFSTRYVFH